MTYSDEKTNELKKFASRFAKSLAGKPLPPENNVQVREISQIVSDLVKIPESGWWKYAFSREPINGRFSDEMRMEMYDAAVECGRQCARQCKERYGNISMKKLAEILGLKVVFRQRPQSSARVLFADFREPDTIHIYEDGILRGNALLKEEQTADAFKQAVDLVSILMAHELFHVLEMRDASMWTRTYRVKLWNLGPVKNMSPVAVLSEIAAMAFAKEMNQLSFSAYVLDAFLVYGYSPKASSALYEEMMAACKNQPERKPVLDVCLS